MKKEIVTKKQIEADIQNSLQEVQRMTLATYKKWTIPAVIIALALAGISIVSPKIGMWGLVGVLVFGIVMGIAEHLLLLRKRKNVSMDDYEITSEPLSDKWNEVYSKRIARRRRKSINSFFLRFESDKIWLIPENNYEWIAEGGMSDFYIYQNVHREDTFIVVKSKDTGEIAMAYPAAFFEYKEG